MMHQIKRFIVVAAVASMVPAIAFASTARMTGLNVPGDYVKDYTGMFTYLSSVNSTGNLVYGDAGTMFGPISAGDQAMGAVLPNLFDGKAGVWAIHMRRYHPALGQSSTFSPINGAFYYDDNFSGAHSYDPNVADESFDLMWGHKMGSANIGLRLNRTFQSYDDGTTTTEGDGNDGRNIFGFGGGLGFDMNENTNIEVGLQYQGRSFDDGTNSEDGGAAYLVSARAWMKRGGNMTFVPVVKLWSIDQSWTNGTVSFDEKNSGWQLGGAGNWTIGQDDLFVFGAQFVGNSRDEGDAGKYTQSLMPNLFMSLETHLNPWLTFRCGAQQTVMGTEKFEATGVSETAKLSYFSFMMGTTVKMGSLQFDAVLDPAFLNNPFAQLTGGTNAVYEGAGYYGGARAEGGPGYATVFPQVSLTYTW